VYKHRFCELGLAKSLLHTGWSSTCCRSCGDDTDDQSTCLSAHYGSEMSRGWDYSSDSDTQPSYVLYFKWQLHSW